MERKNLIFDRGKRKRYSSQRSYRFLHLKDVPFLGIFHPSIEEAAELIAVDMFFNGLYPEKEPKNFDGDPQNPALIKSLDKDIEGFKSRLITAVEKGQIKANPINRNLDDQLIPEISHINIGDLRHWLSERGYSAGDIFREYGQAELAALERVCDEVIFIRTYRNRHDGEEIDDLIRSLRNDNKLKDPRVVELIGRYKYEFAQNLELRNRKDLAEPAKVDRPVSTRARRTMLTIIAALCRMAMLNFEERGVAKKIGIETEEMGSPVDDETVRKLFAEIPDALETRMK